MNFRLVKVVAAVGAATILGACALFSAEPSLAPTHPEALPTGRPTCTECHNGQVKGVQKPYASFNHSGDFVLDHRLQASRDERICTVCHARSFCVDCHATKIEMKPPLKLGNRPDRDLVHRGDYLTRHRVDGKVDPASCYPCHGRANNEKCRTCHR